MSQELPSQTKTVWESRTIQFNTALVVLVPFLLITLQDPTVQAVIPANYQPLLLATLAILVNIRNIVLRLDTDTAIAD